MRIAPRPPAAHPWYLRPFFWNQRRRFGSVLNPALLWGRRPPLFFAVAFLARFLDRGSSPLPAALRSLVSVRVSQINWCAFCVDLNSATLLGRGVAADKVEALAGWRQSNLFDERERAALEYAEAMTRTGGAVDDALMARLKRHFDDDAVVELTGLVAFQNLSSKFNSALGVPAQGFCRLPSGAERTAAGRPPNEGAGG